MKTLVTLATIPIVALGLALGPAFAASAPAKPTKIMNFGKKDPVTFDHSKHQKEMKCEECHHKKNNDKGEHKCGTCHGKEDNAKTKALNAKDAAHKKDVGACFKCHLAEGAKKKMKCADCHKK